MTHSAVLGDSWYAEELGAATLEAVAQGWFWTRLLRRPTGRGVALWWFGRQYPVVATTLAGNDTRALLILERLVGRRGKYLVLFEFIPVMNESRGHWLGRDRPRGALVRLYWRHIAAPVLRRCLVYGQSLTRWEVDRNAAAFGLERDRLCFIPWLASDAAYGANAPHDRIGVLASGRAACDWETVFGAASDAPWPLTVVCSECPQRARSR